MIRTSWFFALLAVFSLASACSTDPAAAGSSGPGTLTLRLTTPSGDDGAVLFEVSGPPIDGATAAGASLQLFTRPGAGNTLTGAVVGDVAGGAVVRLQVPDVGAAAAYTARIIEVADRRNELRASLAGYGLAVIR